MSTVIKPMLTRLNLSASYVYTCFFPQSLRLASILTTGPRLYISLLQSLFIPSPPPDSTIRLLHTPCTTNTNERCSPKIDLWTVNFGRVEVGTYQTPAGSASKHRRLLPSVLDLHNGCRHCLLYHPAPATGREG